MHTQIFETPDGDIDGINTVFTLSHEYIGNSTVVYVNDVPRIKSAVNGWSETSTLERKVTLNIPPILGDTLQILYLYSDIIYGNLGSVDNLISLKGVVENPRLITGKISSVNTLKGKIPAIII